MKKMKCYKYSVFGMYYKTLRIHNLWKFGRFCSKLHKHTSLLLLQNQYITYP
jgi:hypothetical protein